MKGRVSVTVRDSRHSYTFELKRNITVLTGESGRGKTTLFDMIADYDRYGKEAGIRVSCEREIVAISGRNWQEQIAGLEDAIVVIDEDNRFIRSKDFADLVRTSSNYFLLITRSYLGQLPYSVDEIYEISGSKNKRFSPVYHNVDHMYDSVVAGRLPFAPEVIITEDSKSGFQFFKALAERKGIECVSASGKSNIVRLLAQFKDKDTLIVADGAAFGAEIQDVVRTQMLRPEKLGIFLPESFEWLILKSGLVNDAEWEQVTVPEKYIESSEYFSWERYFTDLLVNVTQDQEYRRYPENKSQLPEFYTHERSVEQIKKNMTGIVL